MVRKISKRNISTTRRYCITVTRKLEIGMRKRGDCNASSNLRDEQVLIKAGQVMSKLDTLIVIAIEGADQIESWRPIYVALNHEHDRDFIEIENMDCSGIPDCFLAHSPFHAPHLCFPFVLALTMFASTNEANMRRILTTCLAKVWTRRLIKRLKSYI